MKFVPRTPRDDVNVSDEHPLTEAAILTLGLGIIITVVAAAIIFFVDLVVVVVPPETEARVLESWTPSFLQPPNKDDKRVNETRMLLERLASHWRDAPYPFRLEVTESEDANAMALPGGLIIVTTGLLDRVETENELAFILGHELGHFRNRDHLRGLGRGVALALLLAVIGSSDGASQLGFVITDLTARGFSREQESDADNFGLEIVYAEYGHVNQSWRLFDRLLQEEGGDGLLVYFSTHPSSDDRIEELKIYARRKGWPLDGPTKTTGWQDGGTF